MVTLFPLPTHVTTTRKRWRLSDQFSSVLGQSRLTSGRKREPMLTTMTPVSSPNLLGTDLTRQVSFSTDQFSSAPLARANHSDSSRFDVVPSEPAEIKVQLARAVGRLRQVSSTKGVIHTHAQ